jgi:hypothetical protein
VDLVEVQQDHREPQDVEGREERDGGARRERRERREAQSGVDARDRQGLQQLNGEPDNYAEAAGETSSALGLKKARVQLNHKQQLQARRQRQALQLGRRASAHEHLDPGRP